MVNAAGLWLDTDHRNSTIIEKLRHVRCDYMVTYRFLSFIIPMRAPKILDKVRCGSNARHSYRLPNHWNVFLVEGIIILKDTQFFLSCVIFPWKSHNFFWQSDFSAISVHSKANLLWVLGHCQELHHVWTGKDWNIFFFFWNLRHKSFGVAIVPWLWLLQERYTIWHESKHWDPLGLLNFCPYTIYKTQM